ncbi:MAG: 2-amino-4-hydroxy-6-hydroxymethyldihydropteridine diphosphokinase [Anaerolineaceae bacterium]|nr:2-amino-4-hydroxy-6-hydroxymethyldihydropteridine diphosphokinase [Anaerolineaceae bacterium]
MRPQIPVYLSLGSNIDPERNLPLAVAHLRQELRVLAIAPTWETPPYGTGGANYFNTALHALTHHPLEGLKSNVLRPIETRQGRVRTDDKYAPRPIDLDIIIYGATLIDPRLWTLPFLAIPFASLLPDYRNPETGATLAEVAHQMQQHQPATLRPEIAY